MPDLQARILGLGYFVPPNLRTNDDPIFDWIHEYLQKNPGVSNPFQGYDTRVVLGPGEDLMTMMVPAAMNALQAAKLQPSDIDMLLGYASVSPYTCPNELSHLHQMLEMPQSTYVVPLNNEFSNLQRGAALRGCTHQDRTRQEHSGGYRRELDAARRLPYAAIGERSRWRSGGSGGSFV